VVHPASPSLAEPASLAVLAHRYGAGAPAVVELIRRTGGCTSPIRSKGDRGGLSRLRSSTRPPIDEIRAPGFVLVAVATDGVTLSSLLGRYRVTPTSSSAGLPATRPEACQLRRSHPSSSRRSRTSFGGSIARGRRTGVRRAGQVDARYVRARHPDALSRASRAGDPGSDRHFARLVKSQTGVTARIFALMS